MGYIIGFAFQEKYKRQGGDFMSTIEKQRMLEIEEIATRLLKDESFDDSPSVDIVSIVEKDGFDVRPKEMPISTTGCLFVNDDKKSKERTILVNTRFKNPENEKDVIFKKSRFITAHEYGHFILHKQPEQPLYAHRDSDKRDTPRRTGSRLFYMHKIMTQMEGSGLLSLGGWQRS